MKPATIDEGRVGKDIIYLPPGSTYARSYKAGYVRHPAPPVPWRAGSSALRGRRRGVVWCACS